MESIDIDLGPLSRDEIEMYVRTTRRSAANVLAERFSSANFDAELGSLQVAKSVYKHHVTDLPFPDSARAAAFNTAVTDLCVSSILSSRPSPMVAAFAAARAVELGAYDLLDPDDPAAKPKRFLGVSKSLGYFFTPPLVALEMARAVLHGTDALSVCLDPAAGTGALLSSVLLVSKLENIRIDRVHALEVDELTARYCQLILTDVVERLGLQTSVEVTTTDGVEFLASNSQQFDAIIMNPPYGRIKFLASSLTNAETRTSKSQRSLEDQATFWKNRSAEQSERYRTISQSLGLGAGRQDYQRLFLGSAINVLRQGGRLVCISPASWLGDLDSTPLRKSLINGSLLEQVWLYPEDSRLFPTVNQVTAVTVIASGQSNDSFTFDVRTASQPASSNSPYSIGFSSIRRIDPKGFRIPKVGKDMQEILSTMQTFPRIGETSWIRNVRGELDLTQHKECLTPRKTKYKLLRGDHVERFTFRHGSDLSQPGFVKEQEFLRQVKGTKADDFRRERLAGRQISYLNKPRRLSWIQVGSGVIVANSCNYVVVDESCPYGSSSTCLAALLGLLNSAPIEWYFRIFNSNNHVANYEIDELPVCFDYSTIEAIATAARFLDSFYESDFAVSDRAGHAEDLLDALVCSAFGLSPDQARLILQEVEPHRSSRVAGMVAWIHSNGIPESFLTGNGWYQHVESSLSAHDREVISHIPQGGNWTSIPESVPSKRLEQIRVMTKDRGGLVRTSYYGRLRPDQPSYTIATYYNRPGNGTNIPPWEDRVLTSREAARLQSFPDWYVFASKEAGTRKQIGNAVPPLLAYALGNELALHTGRTCVDLFSGAGGLSLGLELAGFDVIAACDNDARAAATYTLNRDCEYVPQPSSSKTLYVNSDLSSDKNRREAVRVFQQKLDGRKLDLLVGGPPCQGFSHAGFRAQTDERNNLAVAFLDLVEVLKPSVAVLENVEGLLSYRGGQVVRDLLDTFHELGYSTGDSPWLLNAECYGVPQMRRRIFLVATLDGLTLRPPSPTFQKCLGRREGTRQPDLLTELLPYPVTVLDALGDLPKFGDVIHPATGDRPLRRHFAQWARGQISPKEMIEKYTNG